jgi:hypothetical protein
MLSILSQIVFRCPHCQKITTIGKSTVDEKPPIRKLPSTPPQEEIFPERIDLRPRIEMLLKEKPPLSIEKIARRIGARTSAVNEIVREMRREKHESNP